MTVISNQQSPNVNPDFIRAAFAEMRGLIMGFARQA